ncbi:MAG: hypothetical protein ACE5JN_10005 [Candidatus Methylomirabilia bacterium]
MIVGGYMVSHGGVLPGRENLVLALDERARSFWDRQKEITRVGPFYLAPGGGAYEDMTFFALYLGRLDTLQKIIASEEYEKILAVAVQVTKNFKTRLFGGGEPAEVGRIVSTTISEWKAAGVMKG